MHDRRCDTLSTMTRRFFLLLTIIFGLFVWTDVGAAESSRTVILDDSTEKIDLYLHMEMLKDYERKWSINDVTSEEFSQKFLLPEEIHQRPGFLKL